MIECQIPEKGILLKNLGIQLNTIGTQLQNVAIEISNINCGFGVQIQNFGTQILNISMQIFNIGNQIVNYNEIMKNNEIFINNMMMNINKPIKSNINNSDKNFFFNKINILFISDHSGEIITLFINQKATIKEMFNLFLSKKGVNSEFLKNNYFLFNVKKNGSI